jgi:hypothetical protein
MSTIRESVEAFVSRPEYPDEVERVLKAKLDTTRAEGQPAVRVLGALLMGPALKPAIEADPDMIRQALHALGLKVLVRI